MHHSLSFLFTIHYLPYITDIYDIGRVDLFIRKLSYIIIISTCCSIPKYQGQSSGKSRQQILSTNFIQMCSYALRTWMKIFSIFDFIQYILFIFLLHFFVLWFKSRYLKIIQLLSSHIIFYRSKWWLIIHGYTSRLFIFLSNTCRHTQKIWDNAYNDNAFLFLIQYTCIKILNIFCTITLIFMDLLKAVTNPENIFNFLSKDHEGRYCYLNFGVTYIFSYSFANI